MKPRERRTIIFDDAIFTKRLRGYRYQEQSRLTSEIALLKTKLEQSKSERVFSEDYMYTSDIELGYCMSSVLDLPNEVNRLKIENRAMLATSKSITEVLVDKNKYVFENNVVSKDLVELLNAPQFLGHKHFENQKSKLPDLHKKIITLNLEIVRLNSRSRMIQYQTELCKKNLSFLTSNQSLDDAVLSVVVENLSTENLFLNREIERFVPSLKDASKKLASLSSTRKDSGKRACITALSEEVVLANIMFKYDERLDQKQLLQRMFKEDKEKKVEDKIKTRSMKETVSALKRDAQELADIHFKMDNIRMRTASIKYAKY